MSRPWLQLLDPELHGLRQASGPSFEARLQLAHALNVRCHHTEARGLLEGLLTEDRANGKAWFERIVAEGDDASGEDLETLSQDLEALLDESPDTAVPYRNLGYLRILQQRPEDAKKTLDRALELDGRDSRTFELLGLLALRCDEAAEAKNWFLKALSLKPKSPRSLRLLGIACEQLGEAKVAETHFAAALESEPHYFWGWHSLGELLLKQGSVEEGLREGAKKGFKYPFQFVDLEFELHFGKYHDVDSSQDAFYLCAIEAFREAEQKAGIVLLEPIMKVVVFSPKDYHGQIVGNIISKRGIIEDTAEDKGIAQVTGHLRRHARVLSGR